MAPSELSPDAREATRQHILDALERVLATQGLHGLSIRRVAAEAGCAIGTVYLYFAHKDALLHAWMLRGFGMYMDRIRAIPPAVMAQPRAALEAILRAYVAFALDNDASFRLAVSPGIRGLEPIPPLDHPSFLDQPGNDLVTAQLRALAAQGVLDPAAVPWALASLWSATQGLVLTLLDQPGLDPVWRAGLIDFHVALLLDGLLRAPAGGGR